ncbi:MAG: hypothetical protein ACLUEQ_01460 [Cloacibacillus evryensis]
MGKEAHRGDGSGDARRRRRHVAALMGMNATYHGGQRTSAARRQRAAHEGAWRECGFGGRGRGRSKRRSTPLWPRSAPTRRSFTSSVRRSGRIHTDDGTGFSAYNRRQARAQILEREDLPNAVVAVGGGRAINAFTAFIADTVAASRKWNRRGAAHIQQSCGDAYGGSASVCSSEAICHRRAGNPAEVYSIAAGLDCPSVGPARRAQSQRARGYICAGDKGRWTFDCCRTEGIIPALESSHARRRAGRSQRMNPGDV